MTDMDKLLRDESDAIEANPAAPPTDATKVSRPGMERAKVLSVRLNPEEFEELRRLAATSGVGPPRWQEA